MEINSRLFDALGMTLVDSLWQGAIIMSIAFLGLWLMKKRKASVRHNFLLICMLALPVLGIYSFSQRFERATPIDISTNEEVIANGLPSFDFSTESIPTTEVAQSETFEWMEMIPWIGILWTIGLAFILIRSAGSYLYLNRLKATAIDIVDDEIIRQFNALKESVNLKGRVLLRESAKVSSPMVYGYLKPIILFPLGLIQGLTMDEVEVILLHELAHIKRNDFLINIIINGLRAVYFYHPAFWWLQSQLDNEREFAADEMVMEKKTDGLVLVRALSKAQEFSMLSPSLGFAGSSKNQLLKRVNRIMKKQQKPNWTGLFLPFAILLSVFLLSSQSEKAELNDLEGQPDTKELVAQDDTVKNISIPLFTRDSLNKPQFTGQYKKTYWIPGQGKSLQSDSVSLAKATMELLEDPSPVTVTVGSDGKPIQIKRNGKVLAGETLKVYEEAYLKLNKYATEAADKRMSGFMGGNESVTKRAGENLEELNRLVEIRAQEASKRDRMVRDLTKNQNPSIDQIKAVPLQVERVTKLEENIATMINRITPEQKRLFYQNHEVVERQKQLIDQTQMVELDKKLALAARQLLNMLLVEKERLDQMILRATEDPINEDPKALNDQVIKLDRLKKELLAYPAGDSNMQKYIDDLSSLEEVRKQQENVKNQVLELQRQVVEQDEKIKANQKEEDLIRISSYSNDHKLVELPRGKESFEFFKEFDEYTRISSGNPIVEIDGVLKPKIKLSDVKMDNVIRFEVLKGKPMQKRYPNGETKGYSGLVAIKTFKGMKDSRINGSGAVNSTTFSKEESKHTRINGSGAVNSTTFSKEESKHTFSEDNTGQSQARSTLDAAQFLEENYVVVFNGKFVPKIDLLEDRDTYIKEINIYKGDALKKFPKRKTKGYEVVIEVITK